MIIICQHPFTQTREEKREIEGKRALSCFFIHSRSACARLWRYSSDYIKKGGFSERKQEFDV
jgi:hypothetical protein